MFRLCASDWRRRRCGRRRLRCRIDSGEQMAAEAALRRPQEDALSDVDLKNGLVHISQQAQPKRGGGFEFAEPKTSASKATLELTSNQIAILRKHRQRQVKERL